MSPIAEGTILGRSAATQSDRFLAAQVELVTIVIFQRYGTCNEQWAILAELNFHIGHRDPFRCDWFEVESLVMPPEIPWLQIAPHAIFALGITARRFEELTSKPSGLRKYKAMTGYTVHTGSNENFSNGWDRIFGDEGKKSTQKKKTTKKQPATGKSSMKPGGNMKPGGKKSTKAKKKKS